MDSFANRFTKALELKNITAAELSRILGLNEGTISNYKKGNYVPKQRRLESIANALDVSIAWLMGADVPMKKADVKKHPVTNDEEEIAKVALFGGSEEVTDEMWNEVKNYVEFIKQRNKKND